MASSLLRPLAHQITRRQLTSCQPPQLLPPLPIPWPQPQARTLPTLPLLHRPHRSHRPPQQATLAQLRLLTSAAEHWRWARLSLSCELPNTWRTKFQMDNWHEGSTTGRSTFALKIILRRKGALAFGLSVILSKSIWNAACLHRRSAMSREMAGPGIGATAY